MTELTDIRLRERITELRSKEATSETLRFDERVILRLKRDLDTEIDRNTRLELADRDHRNAISNLGYALRKLSDGEAP